MSLPKRAKALRDFQNDPPTKSAGAIGINLTGANRVFILEPCFDPLLEQQAIGRVWRLGQTREVKIYRMIIQDSVEERMQEMLWKKYGGAVIPPAAGNDGGNNIDEVAKPAPKPSDSA
eukprot:scaffold24543_cov195-Amphora_coffeaeformis.AAC.1